MVMGEVGKNSEFDGEPEGTKLSESMRGDLENEKFGAGIGDFFDALVKSKSINSSHVAEFGCEFIYAMGNGGHEAGFQPSVV